MTFFADAHSGWHHDNYEGETSPAQPTVYEVHRLLCIHQPTHGYPGYRWVDKSIFVDEEDKFGSTFPLIKKVGALHLHFLGKYSKLDRDENDMYSW